jgi:hypothetical protein
VFASGHLDQYLPLLKLEDKQSKRQVNKHPDSNVLSESGLVISPEKEVQKNRGARELLPVSEEKRG